MLVVVPVVVVEAEAVVQPLAEVQEVQPWEVQAVAAQIVLFDHAQCLRAPQVLQALTVKMQAHENLQYFELALILRQN